MSLSGIDLTATNPNGTASPCGLIAKRVFTDNYTMTSVDTGNPVTITETGIAWKSDIKKFKNL